MFFKSIVQMILLECTNAVSFRILGMIIFISRTIKRVLLGLFIFVLASASVVVATIVGAMEGHTTDIGFLQGGLLGVVAGVITAVQFFEPVLHGEPLSKVALVKRLVNGKVIMGLVRPALLKAYQWQIMAVDTNHIEISDMYYSNQETRGLSRNTIQNILKFYNCSDNQYKSSCPICLQDWEEGEVGRKLERCGHTFHMDCIDEWLLKQVTCPICRDHLDHSYHTCA